MDNKANKPKTKKKVANFIIDFTEHLGTGQYGKVYKTVDQTNQRVCAVKVIEKGEIFEDEYTKNAIIREIEIMKNLKSPNIIELVDMQETANNIYIFQELAPDGTLRNRLAKHDHKRADPQTAMKYITGLLTGMAELVHHGIIHRDIKPENILMKGDDVKIADFGFSRISDAKGSNTSGVGTPVYMAPEVLQVYILQTGSYNYKCDIWSFGVVCYEILTGTLPWGFNSKDFAQLLSEIKRMSTTNIKYPPGVNISDEFKDLIAGCLRFEPKNRFTWSEIYEHKIFGGEFKQLKNIAFEGNFTITEIRQKVHENNINVEKLLQKLPDKLTKQDLYNLLKAFDEQVGEKQSESLFAKLSKDSQYVQIAALKQFFETHGIKLKGIKNNAGLIEQFLKKNKNAIEAIKKNIDEGKVDFKAILQPYRKSDKLEMPEFKQVIMQLSSKTATAQEVDDMFKFFNPENMKGVRTAYLYEKLCKITQVPAVKDDKLSKEIKLLEERKKN